MRAVVDAGLERLHVESGGKLGDLVQATCGEVAEVFAKVVAEDRLVERPEAVLIDRAGRGFGRVERFLTQESKIPVFEQDLAGGDEVIYQQYRKACCSTAARGHW